MSKPLSPMQPVTFEDRVKRVQTEVTTRIASTPASEQNHHRARLWCAWIRRNLLSDKPAARPYPLNVWGLKS